MINPFSSHASHPTVKTPGHINFCCSCLRVDCVGAWSALLRLLLLSSLMLTPGVVFVFGLLCIMFIGRVATSTFLSHQFTKIHKKAELNLWQPRGNLKEEENKQKISAHVLSVLCFHKWDSGHCRLSRILTTNVIKGRFQANIRGIPHTCRKECHQCPLLPFLMLMLVWDYCPIWTERS